MTNTLSFCSEFSHQFFFEPGVVSTGLMQSAGEWSRHPNDYQGWEKGCDTAVVNGTATDIDVNICECH